MAVPKRPLQTARCNDSAAALTAVVLAGLDLTAAHNHALAAAQLLSHSRAERARELAEMIATAMSFAVRLGYVVEGDMRSTLPGV